MKTEIEGLTKTEIIIPKSAATKNLMLCALCSAVALTLALFNVPIWLVIPAGGIAGGFLLSAIACILDIQEFSMKQQQEVINELKKLNNSK